jgi:hypothetical protein
VDYSWWNFLRVRMDARSLAYHNPTPPRNNISNTVNHSRPVTISLPLLMIGGLLKISATARDDNLLT